MQRNEPEPPHSKNDYVWAVLIGVLVGGILGAISGFVLPGVYYSLVNPAVLKDGQYGLIYLASLPVGALLGAVFGAAYLCLTTAKMHDEE